MATMPALLVGVKQAAKITDLSPGKIRDLIRRRKLKVVRVDRRVLIDPEELRAFIEEVKKSQRTLEA